MSEETDNCVFCKIAGGEIPCDKIYENKNFITFFDANPRADGHTLVVPKRHFKTILDMPNSLGTELLDAIKNAALDLIKKGKAEGFNVIMNNYKVAGQIVEHAHFHIIPRKGKDGLKILA